MLVNAFSMTRISSHLPYTWGHHHLPHISPSFQLGSAQTMAPVNAPMKGTRASFSESSHPLQSDRTGSRVHIKATPVTATRMRELKDDPFLAEHVELQKHIVRKELVLEVF